MSTRRAPAGDRPRTPLTDEQFEGACLQVMAVAEMVRHLPLDELSRGLPQIAADGEVRIGRVRATDLRALARMIDPLLQLRSLAHDAREELAAD